ncbi:MAG: DUF2924 domain-containing protein [Rhizobiaceae bacterium]|jgi:hypothetical protein
MSTVDRLEGEIAGLGDLSRDTLAQRWKQIHGCPPPRGIHADLLLRAATWHVQAKHLGGISGNTRRLLKIAMANAERNLAAKRDRAQGEPTAGVNASQIETIALPRQLGIGTRLIREWNGRTYMVDITESGYLLDGKTYRSLSAIARHITGAHWSGPRFFGR